MRTIAVLLVAVPATLGGTAYVYRDTLFSRPPAVVPAPPADTTSFRTRVMPLTPDPGAESPDPGPAPGSPPVAKEARAYVEHLVAADPAPVPVDRADHFVREHRMLDLGGERPVEVLTPRRVVAEAGADLDRPITLVRELDQVERASPEALLADSGGDLEATVRVVESDGGVTQSTVREVLERFAGAPEQPIAVMRTSEFLERTTARALQSDPDLPADEPIKVIRRPYRTAEASVADLMMGTAADDEDSVYYVRTVRPDDDQGIWGIVHDGLIENFARGMAVRRGKEINTYRVEIPRDADELLADRSSSFLGRLIQEKVRQSYVYNFRQRRMGRNPDVVHAGQEIVLIRFNSAELASIYEHFVAERG